MSSSRYQFVDEIYLREVLAQIEYASIAWKDVHEALKTHNVSKVFYGLHAFLSHVANVSKIFWPAKSDGSRALNRGARLRSLLGLRKQGVMAKRRLRNHLEHYDARLDGWATDSHRHNYVDCNIGLAPVGGVDECDMMRNYDPSSETFTFQGESFDLVPILSEMTSLESDIEGLLRSLGRFALI